MKKEDLERNIQAREQEIYGYQINIDNFSIIIEMINDEWTEDIIMFKNFDSEKIIDVVPEDKQELVSDLIFKDKISRQLKIEKLEQRKAIHVLEALKAQQEEK